MKKDNIPTGAQYYTSGQVKKYWKIELHQTKYHWFIWSKMLGKWLPMRQIHHISGAPENLVKI